MSNSRRGFNLIELAVVIGIILVLGILILINLPNGKNQTDLNSATTQVAAVLRQAQSQAMSQQKNVIWGVYFSNATGNKPFYALFTGSSYVSGTVQGQYPLPPSVGYLSSTLPVGSSESITFSQIAGASSASTSLGLYLISNPSIVQYVSVSGLGEVSYNSGVYSGSSGNLSGSVWVAVADEGDNRVEEFNSSGTYQFQLGCVFGPCVATTTSGGFENVSGFINMDGIAIDPSGNIWVADYQDSRVEKFNASGTYVSQLGCVFGPCVATTTSGGLDNPGGVAVDSNGNTWVADFGANRVDKFNASGTYVSQIGCVFGPCAATTTSDGFNDPDAIAVDPSGNVWVADFNNSRVEKFNSSGAYQFQIPCVSGACTPTSTSGGFNYPNGIAVDPSGNVWVADYQNNRVEKFNSSGVYQSQLGCTFGPCASSSTNGDFGGEYGPGILHAIAADANGNIWVSDEGNNRVEKFNSSGAYVSQLGCGTSWCALTSTPGEFDYTGMIGVY